MLDSREVGQRVVYCSDYGLAGVVKFAGPTEFSDGHDWVGELPAMVLRSPPKV